LPALDQTAAAVPRSGEPAAGPAAAELRERRRIEARTNERSAFLLAMYAYARPRAEPIIEPAMRLTDRQRTFIYARVIAFILVAALAAIIFGLAR
jgi:hypothetical protein